MDLESQLKNSEGQLKVRSDESNEMAMEGRALKMFPKKSFGSRELGTPLLLVKAAHLLQVLAGARK